MWISIFLCLSWFFQHSVTFIQWTQVVVFWGREKNISLYTFSIILDTSICPSLPFFKKTKSLALISVLFASRFFSSWMQMTLKCALNLHFFCYIPCKGSNIMWKLTVKEIFGKENKLLCECNLALYSSIFLEVYCEINSWGNGINCPMNAATKSKLALRGANSAGDVDSSIIHRLEAS